MQYKIPQFKLMYVQDGYATVPAKTIGSPEEAATAARSILDGVDRETLIVLLLDKHHSLIGWNRVSEGTLDQTLADPKQMLKPLINSTAATFILAHNHMSARDPEPSAADRKVTRHMAAVGALIHVPLMDSIIIGMGTTKYFSFQEASSYDLKCELPF